ncbi:MAG: PQQ-dependent sugar dehydrogenase [Thaumarchaeota archaeon]|nr:PQQ-dependent sugar dehydrogenase [Nitrososphaerota archaeon]
MHKELKQLSQNLTRLIGRTIALAFLFVVLVVGTRDVLAQEFPQHDLRVETIAENLDVPWAIAFAPDGRIFVTERTGALQVIEDDSLQNAPVLKLDVGGAEGGLLGLTLDPNFEENHYLYLYYTYSEFLSTYNRVSRFTESNNSVSDELVLIDKIPGAAIHDGGRIKFSPDGKLYITTGDAANMLLAQNLDSLAGKILRINPDGTIPHDNPFADSPVYSYGHRNPQGLDWEPTSGILVATEHGPSGDKGFARDEINIISAGKNYGWPEITGDEEDPKYVSPIFHTGDVAWAPSGAAFYDGNRIPDLKGKFLVANLRGVHLHAFEIDTTQGKILSEQSLFSGTFGRLRDVHINDGYIYLLTSNQDGRGSPRQNDDRILKVMPLNQGLQKETQEETCSAGLELVIKASNGNPACVKPATKLKLIERGWARN